jgi:hypothetical protein
MAGRANIDRMACCWHSRRRLAVEANPEIGIDIEENTA